MIPSWTKEYQRIQTRLKDFIADGLISRWQAAEADRSLSLFGPDFIQGTARKLMKKFIKLSSNKHHSTAPDPKGNLVPRNPGSKCLLCNT